MCIRDRSSSVTTEACPLSAAPMSAVLPFCTAMLGSTRPLASSSVTTEACPLTRGSSSEVVLGGGFLGGGGGGGGGGSLSEYLYERWGGLKSRHDEKRGEPAAVPYPGVRPCKRGRRRLYISKCKRGRRRLYISPAGAGRRPCYMLYCTGLLF